MAREINGARVRAAVVTLLAALSVCPAFGQSLVRFYGDRKDAISYYMGYKDSTGRVVIGARFDDIGHHGDFHGSWAVAALDGIYGLIDTSGRFIAGPAFDDIGPFEGGFARVRLDGRIGYIDTTGRVRADVEYEDGDPYFVDGRTTVLLGNDPVLIDTNGRRITAPGRYERVRWSGEGRGVVVRGGCYGFIDSGGVEVISPRYDYAYGFSDGRAPVAFFAYEYVHEGHPPSIEVVGGPWGFIDGTGTLVIPTNFSTVSAFTNGLATACLDGRCGMIDTTGAFVIAPRYEMIGGNCDGVLMFKEHGLYGYMDASEHIIVPPLFESVEQFCDGFGWATDGNVWIKFDRQGNEVERRNVGVP